MDDTQKDGSDSDWDSTLDFTSPRQPIGNFMPRMQDEIEDEESALSNESDVDEANIDASVQEKNSVNTERNLLQPRDERSRSPSPLQKENNIIKAQQQKTTPRRTPRQAEGDAAANQYSQEKEPPPYNFKEAVTGKFTPEPGGRQPPGKERKGNTYDPAPSPTPRGIPVQQGSIRSIGSWDESDPDERTLKELRTNFNKEKQKEEQQKSRQRELEERSYAEDPPHTNRSETTWKSWAKDKIQRKPKTSQQTQQQSQQVTPQITPQLRHQPRQDASQMSQVSAQRAPLRVEVSPPSVTHSTAYQYPTPSPQVPPPREVHIPQYDMRQMQAASYTEIVGAEFPDEPKKLFVYDEDRGRYTYYFGHGNLKYFEVNDDFDEAKLPPYADKCERLSKRIWQEIFAVIRIVFCVFIWFFIELFRYVAKHIFQPIVHGIFATIGDFVFKPFLSALFNGFMQPFSIFLWNVFTGMRHVFRPIGEILERVFEQFAMLFRSIRLFEINWNTAGPYRQQVEYNSAQVI